MTHQPASDLVVGAHDSITHLLSQPSWEQWDSAVIMLSRLIAADTYVLASGVAEHLPAGAADVRELADRRLDLEHSLLALYNRVHGDGRLADVPLSDVQQRTLAAARPYLALRDDVARDLLDAVDDNTAAKLAARWSVAVTTGATRPHPWLTGRRPQGAVGFHWTRLWDRVRDTLDSRPTGRPAVA